MRIFAATLSMLVLSAVAAIGQTNPAPSPTPRSKTEAPDQVKVFTEEVRLQVAAVDEYGHFDPSLEIDDVLVLEDGEPQTIRSVRHIPANVLLVLDTGGDGTGLGGMQKKTSLTRDVALRIITRLRDGDRIAVIQSASQAEVLQPWTDDVERVAKVLKTKLFAGKRSRVYGAMTKAAQLISDRPEGSRHVVLVTDGVESPDGKVRLNDAIQQLRNIRATVHVLSYTTFVRQKSDKKSSDITFGQQPGANNPIASNDPTMPAGTTRSPSFGVSIRFDPAMRKVRKAYEEQAKKSEEWLTELADETGGRLFLPKTTEEMIAGGEEVARSIGAEYVVTYRPKKPLSSAEPGEYRRVEVASRKVGLHLRSRRGYVVPSSN